jgi:hypothetical protein
MNSSGFPALSGGIRDRLYTARAAKIGDAFCHVKNLCVEITIRARPPIKCSARLYSLVIVTYDQVGQVYDFRFFDEMFKCDTIGFENFGQDLSGSMLLVRRSVPDDRKVFLHRRGSPLHHLQLRPLHPAQAQKRGCLWTYRA